MPVRGHTCLTLHPQARTMNGWGWIRLALRSHWPVLLLLASGCAELPPRPVMPVESAVAAGSGSELDRLIAPAEERYPGQAGFRLVSQGPEAFAVRAHAA